MPLSSVAPYLTDIVEAILAIEHIREKAGTTPLEAFKRDWESNGSFSRIQIVSEASRRLPTMKARYPAIPWPKIAPVGNILRHNTADRAAAPVGNRATPAGALEAACREELARSRLPSGTRRSDCFSGQASFRGTVKELGSC